MLPKDDPLIAPFWEAAKENRLLICCCKVCDIDIWYPQAQCPRCNVASDWRELKGRARLLSWTTVRRQINGAFDVPYTPAIVVPEDAPTVQLVTQLQLSDGHVPVCDMPLQVQFAQLKPLQGEAFAAPVFTEC